MLAKGTINVTIPGFVLHEVVWSGLAAGSTYDVYWVTETQDSDGVFGKVAALLGRQLTLSDAVRSDQVDISGDTAAIDALVALIESHLALS